MSKTDDFFDGISRIETVTSITAMEEYHTKFKFEHYSGFRSATFQTFGKESRIQQTITLYGDLLFWIGQFCPQPAYYCSVNKWLF